MDKQKLVKKLKEFIEKNKLKNSKVETDLGLPKNSLSNFLSEKKALPDKWINPIMKYALGDLADKVTTADKIPVHGKELTEWDKGSEMELNQMIEGKRLLEFCKQNKTNPDDLFSWLMDNYCKVLKTPPIDLKQGKETKFHDFTQDKSYSKPYNPFDNPIYNAKMSNKKHQP